MNDDAEKSGPSALEIRSRVLFHGSIAGIDMPRCSQLTQARHAALRTAAMRGDRPWFLQLPGWTTASGLMAAALLTVALWFGSAGSMHESGDGQANMEDLDIVASSDTASGDAIEMLQDDIDFYDFAEKAMTTGPAA